MKYLTTILAIGMLSVTAQAQFDSIVNSPHNLSASGPGRIRAATEAEICIFCHAAHNAAPVKPLWNRQAPVTAYVPYTSPSLVAKPGQPTGSSKLCLSCHDGTIALGSVLSRGQPVVMAGGVTTLPPGASNLGTDLRDDHPISFVYDDTLATRSPKLRTPGVLPPAVKLDWRHELQCTSCHDAHNNRYGRFLVMDNTNSQLCNACHNQGQTDLLWHTQCASCHQSHTAPSGPYLLKNTNVTQTCVSCHDGRSGSNQGANVAADLSKVSRHDTNFATTLTNHIPNDVTCSDCHEPHTMIAQGATAPVLSPRLGAIDGVNAAGAPITRAQFQYEVCFKCHDNISASRPRMISRKIVQPNKRLQFAPAAVSFHPVEVAGKNNDVPSLRTGLTTASMIYCTDCHDSDTSKAASGSGPASPHGSNKPPLLIAEYSTADNTPESAAAYALCYRCHDRAAVLSDQTFPHSRHLTANAPCSACHDSHGISSSQGTATNNAHLINFDITIVLPSKINGQLVYTSTGSRTGTCSLNCHGSEHAARAYPVAAAARARGVRGAAISPVRPKPKK